MSKKENEFMQIVEGGGSEEDLRILFESRLELSSNVMMWLMSTAIAIAVIIAELKTQFNLAEWWGFILFIAYLLIIVVAFPLVIRGRMKDIEKGRLEIFKQYLEAKQLLQKKAKSE